MAKKLVQLLGERMMLSGSDHDAYFEDLEGDRGLVRSVIEGVLPFVPADGVCIDVGASLGLYSIALSRRFPGLQVYAVEPVPDTFQHLERNLAANAPSCVALQHACGAKDESARIQFVSRFSAGSHFSVEGSLAGVETSGDQAVEVSVRTLDSIARQLQLPRVDLIKIDVEGFELDVLEGASDVLKKWQPITQIEFNSWTFMSHRRLLPQDVIEKISATFPYVYVHERYGARLAKISLPVDQQSLMYATVVHGGVDNLLCAFSELVPDAPHFANVWPQFVENRNLPHRIVKGLRKVFDVTRRTYGSGRRWFGLIRRRFALSYNRSEPP